MTVVHERSAGVIPFRSDGGQGPLYLVLHSATVRNPRAKWEFPKGGIEPGETPRSAAAREFQEETGITAWTFREGFERSLTYTYVRRGRKVIKTVTYFIVEVFEDAPPTRSVEHVEDTSGHWYHWAPFNQVARLLYHAKIRHLFTEADAWLRGPQTSAGLQAGG
jgi:bis(5'-nucleosidyl)-tetraphosphatase